MNWIGPIRCEEKNGTYREAKADISFIGETTRHGIENTDPFFSQIGQSGSSWEDALNAWFIIPTSFPDPVLFYS